MSPAKRVIVVNKGTAYERMLADGKINTADPFSDEYLERILASHHRHHEGLTATVAILDEFQWDYDVVPWNEFHSAEGYDLALSLGGDGTVLHVSHGILGVPLLGVNSDPERSRGYFCGTLVEGVREALLRFDKGELEAFELARLRLELDGKPVGPPALNDVLIANRNPAATSRYVLIAGSRAERQKSSGLWISTPAGSTAGIRSAGGVVLPLEGAQLEYLVREPVVAGIDRYELLRGVRNLDEGLTIVSQMTDGCAYVDGPFVQVPIPVGAELRLSAHQPLTLLGLEPSRRER